MFLHLEFEHIYLGSLDQSCPHGVNWLACLLPFTNIWSVHWRWASTDLYRSIYPINFCNNCKNIYKRFPTLLFWFLIQQNKFFLFISRTKIGFFYFLTTVTQTKISTELMDFETSSIFSKLLNVNNWQKWMWFDAYAWLKWIYFKFNI